MTVHRDRKFLDLAHRVNRCQFNLQGCLGYSADGMEPAHSNQQKDGKGMGIKAHDFRHVAACTHCHSQYDGRIPRPYTRMQLEELFDEAWQRTLTLYFTSGWLKVA